MLQRVIVRPVFVGTDRDGELFLVLSDRPLPTFLVDVFIDVSDGSLHITLTGFVVDSKLRKG